MKFLRGDRRKFREMDQTRIGVIGLVLVAVLIVLSLNVSTLQTAFSRSVHADFSESGGLKSGDDVRVAGRTVGKVRSVELKGKYVTVSFTADGVVLGEDTEAFVKSDNALGRRFLSIVPRGTGSRDSIPLGHTDPGIAVNTALGELTANTAQLDTAQLTKSFDSLTAILERTPEEFRGALEGLSEFSRSISTRDAALGQLLQSASGLSSVLANRSRQITAIMGDGTAILDELQARREVVRQLLSNVEGAAAELEGLVRDNRNTLTPALRQIHAAAQLLTKYRGDLDFVLKNIGGFIRSLGEAVGSGPFFQAYVQNLTSPSQLGPIIPDIVRAAGSKK
jgi:phospholipid/cholesterol/gamma-HCH transport system substrate-binding protein